MPKSNMQIYLQYVTNLKKMEQQFHRQLERLCKCLHLAVTEDKENVEPNMFESCRTSISSVTFQSLKLFVCLFFGNIFVFFIVEYDKRIAKTLTIYEQAQPWTYIFEQFIWNMATQLEKSKK